ncbi:MAG TPA: hypothetical protein VNT56_09160, partial [Acidimicrobiales bacterium]|nr:hypothetical protein [Acidimicrobiales bacterium]
PRRAGAVPVDGSALGAAPSWWHLAAAGSGVPAVELRSEGTLGDWCQVSADFRGAYYGVAPFLVDDPAGELGDGDAFPALVTVGLVDPAECLWGKRPTRHGRRPWRAPRVDLARLEAESDLGPWARARLVPKVVVATQTRVVEAAVDAGGQWLPSTPLISAVADPGRLWHLAAALSSPPVSAWALHRWGGTALSAGGLKLSAAQVRAIPSPPPGAGWDEAAAALREASTAADATGRRRWLRAAGEASSRAYGVPDSAVVDWWEARLPAER